MAVFFANGCHKIPSKTFVFNRGMGGQPWNDPAEYPLHCEANFSEVFRNAFMVNSFDGDEHLIIIRDEHIIIFDNDMHQLNSLNYKKDVHNALI